MKLTMGGGCDVWTGELLLLCGTICGVELIEGNVEEISD
jgi:hypothetical protein